MENNGKKKSGRPVGTKDNAHRAPSGSQTKPIPGRPAHKPEGSKNKTPLAEQDIRKLRQFRANDFEWIMFKDSAQLAGKTVSEFIRDAVFAAIDKQLGV